MPDKRNVPEEISSKNKDQNPGNAPGDIIDDETPIGHTPDARDEGRKGPYNWYKSSKNDRFPTIFFVKLVSALKMLLV